MTRSLGLTYRGKRCTSRSTMTLFPVLNISHTACCFISGCASWRQVEESRHTSTYVQETLTRRSISYAQLQVSFYDTPDCHAIHLFLFLSFSLLVFSFHILFFASLSSCCITFFKPMRTSRE
ncbi:uncharacterized protein BDW43DRAFT_257611 [Aspergillus alliaceus]|uniref:uncharacterized protein n=1 Tax=Petromyces alliaceus TaxID=209559 RepID=UPI0012A4D3F9|nr:uncharacterized protein BDW43DRAFT_257611 [Aspergillus alliaceus]KAB8239331.1 hypothetical protein BDW43DRAFT_257611 [Aspergillus alliaceus]